MGILDKFKSKKEQEIQDAPKKVVEVSDKPKASKEEDKKVKKAEKKAEKKTFVITEVSKGVILGPIVTEKSASLASSGQYIFKIHPKANRVQVRNAVKSLYGITPVNVNVLNVHGKKVRFGRIRGQRQATKKAIVTLPKGKTIEVFEGV